MKLQNILYVLYIRLSSFVKLKKLVFIITSKGCCMNDMSHEGNKYAHSERDKDGKIVDFQLLTDHLINTGEYAAEIGSEIGCYYLSYLLGVLHDCGKSKHSFQRRILGLSNKNVNHSSAGTVYLWFKINELQNEIRSKGLNTSVQRRELLFYAITAHHGLYDHHWARSEYSR